MPDLLLELFSEEIPARMQAKAADDLRAMVTNALVDAGLVYEGARAFVTPRRLTLWVQGLPARQPDLREEKKGPRVGAPENAVAGFLKSAGLASLSEATIQKDPKKGDFYVALIEKPGRAAIEVIAEIVPKVIRTFPWPKSMRWGAASAKHGALTWVRPLHSIVATFGPETEDPDVVPFDIGGIKAGNTTRGHRFLAPNPFTVRRLDDYVAKLEAAKVVLDPARRREIILADAKNLAFAQGYELVEDAALLAEVTGLVEWPVVLMGSFDEAFLAIPPEVIRTTIRANQKCFVLSYPSPHVSGGEGSRVGGSSKHANDSPHPRPLPTASGGRGDLANRFVLVANIEASDGGAAIVAGNERVIRARLSDAKFFYETDLKTPLEARIEKLKEIVFHEKLGTQFERVERIVRLARELAPIVGADPDKAERAARLAKADLVTEMVGEFPELQGLMGKYYAQAQGEDEAVARAIEEHYKPVGPSDRVPTDPVSIAVALADKIDTLVGFWAIDEKPTGSKDPYALRRAALGVIRLILERQLRIPLKRQLDIAIKVLLALVRLDGIQQLSKLHVLLSQNIDLLQFLRDVKSFKKTWTIPFFGPILESHYRSAAEQALSFSRHYQFDPHDRSYHVADREALSNDHVQFLEKHRQIRHLHRFVFDLARAYHDRLFKNIGTPDQSEGIWEEIQGREDKLADDLLSFFHDRLKIQLREQGARHDLVDAVLAQGGEGQDDLLLIVRRVEALAKFLETDDGKNLLAGYKRAANIISIEEKKDGRQYQGKPDPALLSDPIEKHLWNTIQSTVSDASHHIAREDFESAMETLSTLRTAVDNFFEAVLVNADDPAIRENRLKLLNEIREATRAVADFSKIAG